jgi:uncharacterized protein YidB (DUF937 family)
MGLFDSLAGNLAGSLLGNLMGGGGNSKLLSGVIQLLTSSQSGGVGGLMQAFEQKGLGNILSSWISTGQNLPISVEQLTSVLGSSQLQQLAQHMGVTPQAAGSQLADFLPNIIDKLTPNGQVDNSMLEQGLSFLKGQLGPS